MSHWKSFGLAIFTAVYLLGETTLWPESASANIIFDFSGQGETIGIVPCSDNTCSDTTSIGVLTLTDNYVYGTDIPTSDIFVSFQYTIYSSSGEDIGNFLTLGGTEFSPPPARLSFEGGLNSDGSFDAAGQLSLCQGNVCFNADPGGFTAEDRIERNTGSSFSFSNGTVPEPSTWAMTLTSFAGLGWLARLRRRKLTPI